MDFQNMIGSLVEIEVHDAKVVEVTNDRTKTYRTLKQSAVRLDQSCNFAVKKLCCTMVLGQTEADGLDLQEVTDRHTSK